MLGSPSFKQIFCPWCGHDMEMLSALLDLCKRNSLIIVEFSSQRANNVERQFAGDFRHLMLIWRYCNARLCCVLWCQKDQTYQQCLDIRDCIRLILIWWVTAAWASQTWLYFRHALRKPRRPNASDYLFAPRPGDFHPIMPRFTKCSNQWVESMPSIPQRTWSYCYHHTRICVMWRHQMETFSAFLPFCAGNSPVTSDFPS